MDDDRCEHGWGDCFTECDCGRGTYCANDYDSCYSCYLDRRDNYTDCIYCGRWHSPEFDTCFNCRPRGRDEAARDLKLVILARDGFACCYCGARSGDPQIDPRKITAEDTGERPVVLHVDHVLPCRHGGTADPWNLQALCGVCNVAKGSDWRPRGRHHRRRRELIAAYVTYLRGYLSEDEREDLDHDAELDGITSGVAVKLITADYVRRVKASRAAR